MAPSVALASLILLGLVLGFIRYAVTTPGVQNLAFFWGMAVSWIAYVVLTGPIPPEAPANGGFPVVGPIVRNITWEVVTLGGMGNPDWLSEEVVRFIWLAFAGAGIYYYLAVLWSVPLPGHLWLRDMRDQARSMGNPAPTRSGVTTTKEPAAAGRTSAAARRPVRRRGTDQAA